MSNAIRGDVSKITTIKYTNAGSATVKDTIYFILGQILLAMNSALISTANTYLIKGEIEYAKVSTEVWVVGDKIYWIPATSNFSNVAAGGYLAGYATKPAANPSSTGFIMLMPEWRTIENIRIIVSTATATSGTDTTRIGAIILGCYGEDLTTGIKCVAEPNGTTGVIVVTTGSDNGKYVRVTIMKTK